LEGDVDTTKTVTIAICAGVGGIIGVAVGDAIGVSHIIGMVLAGLVAALGVYVSGFIGGR
jgi:hypothetical protein